ncbi:MAG: hypothetical protein LBR83_08105, partial [Clostridiales bacterium]|nr:hypothetical protein [Clostridiales bacterium]
MRGRYARKIPIITAVCFFIFTANAWVTRAMAAELPRLGTASNGADGEDLGDELVFFRRGEGTTVEVPIVMYHLVTTNGSLIGRY